ncbi:MAG: BRCA1-associated protein 2-domain-containing protein [Benniella sp.]|nr:MAG: BRCA1-associated protein 2-domain-containing protein [Benniella sp.]
MNSYHLKLDLLSDFLTQPQTPQQQQDSSTPLPTPLHRQALAFRTIFKPFLPPQASLPDSSQGIPGDTLQPQSPHSLTTAASSGDSEPSPHSSKDYRLGPICVCSLDEPSATAAREKAGSTKNKAQRNKKMVTATTEASSFMGSAGFQTSEPIQGILRLYKDTNEITTGDIHVQSDKEEETASTQKHDREREGAQVIHPDQGTAVCVLAVPSYMSPGDFLNFVGPVRANVSHFRIIRDSSPNRFMVLMKFRTQEATAEFYQRYNGRAFSSLEPEICHVVYLKSIEIRAGSMPPYAFPFFNDDPFLQSSSAATTGTTTSTAMTLGPVDTSASVEGPTNASTLACTETNSESLQLSSGLLLDHPPTGLAELPTCPVCLERMDSTVTGLLTILCQHTFHCHCLSKWGEGSCPVCRYSQKSVKKSGHGHTAPGLEGGLTTSSDGITDDQNVCTQCGTSENLWICLICGHIGCGRYQEGHAYHHYYETSHLYALELETQRVWDYAGDGYVHRLIQNKTDGKLVELPSAADGRNSHTHPSNDVGQEKLDAIGLEYTYLLTSQLESQRMYFDAQMAAMAEQLAQLNSQAKEWEQEASLLSQKNRELTLHAESLEKDKLPGLVKEKKAAEKRVEKLQERLQVLEQQYEEEKEMNEGLRTNQDSFKARLQEKEAEIQDLQEQVRDMMVYLDTQQKVEASPMKHELVNGTIGVVVPPSSSTSAPSGAPSRRKARR